MSTYLRPLKIGRREIRVNHLAVQVAALILRRLNRRLVNQWRFVVQFNVLKCPPADRNRFGKADVVVVYISMKPVDRESGSTR